MCPSELFLDRKLRTCFDLLKSDTKGVVLARQADQKQYHHRQVRQRCLFSRTPVMVRNFRDSLRWIPGMIVKKLGLVTYSVDLGADSLVRNTLTT